MTLALHTTQAARAIEDALACDPALSPAVLMTRAGEALLRCVRANWPEATRILVLAGSGNNGGDGYVLARLLHERSAGAAVVVATAEPRVQPAQDAATAWRAIGGEVRAWQPGAPLPPADLIVDGIFGIGLSRPPDGKAAALIEAANAHGVPILAIDVPSGLDADSGHALGAVIRATRTLSLLARKRGLFTGAAVDVTGLVGFDDLGTSVDETSQPSEGCAGRYAGHVASVQIVPLGTSMLLERADLRRWLRPRRRGAHKGDHGHVLVVGGEHGLSGAVRLAGEAALRAGAGWTSVATRAAHADLVALHRAELMVHGVEDAPALAPLLARADALAIGPGLGQGPWAKVLFEAVVSADKSMVLDADALNLLAKTPRVLSRDVVLTPHPGEAARLLGCTIADVERDRFAAARELAGRFAAVVVLKGAGTLIHDGSRCALCPFGNPGMASGGTGDALTGVIVALLAQGLPAFDAAAAGVLGHALAGDAAACDGERGLLAGDLSAHLRAVLNP